MSFHPPLKTTTFIPLPSSSPTSPSSSYSRPATTLHFTYLPPASSSSHSSAIPEAWTNLPTGTWHALPFSPSPSGESGFYTASIDLSQVTEPQSFEYTYRLRHGEGEEGVDWLGSAGENGRVEVVSPPSSAAEGAAAQKFEDVGGSWTTFEESVKAGSFELKSGGTSGEVEDFDITKILGEAGEGWREGDGVVWEQSSRTWFVPRPLPAGQALSSLSATFPAQLLVLRSTTSAAHPLQRNLVVFPFSTSKVCSALVGGGGGGDGGKLLLRTERDSADGKVEGNVAVAWGEEGNLHTLVTKCVAAAKSVLTGKTYSAPSLTASSTVPPPLELGLCTWNALGADYTLSSVYTWLDNLSLSSPPTSSSFLSSPHSCPSVGTAIKSLLLDDGWQDTSVFVEYSDDDRTGKHAERRALRSFGVKKGWYDLATSATTAAPSAAVSGTATPNGGGEKPSHRREDSGHGRSPDMSTVDFEALERAREGVSVELCAAVSGIKERGVERVGVWMTLLGYWQGIHPDGALADTYDLRLTTLKSTAHPEFSYKVYIPSASDLPTFYNDYFSSLKAAGIDFVKVDDQATIDSIVEQESPQDTSSDEDDTTAPVDIGELKHLLLSSMCQAALDVFGTPDALIHCMAGSPRIWGGSLGVVGPSPSSSPSSPSPFDNARSIVRNSDDFFPDVPSSHRWHIQHNALSAVLSSALKFTPDFDMAQERGEFGEAHLALRGFSGATVWSTDAAAEDGEGEGTAAKKEGGEGGWKSLLATTKVGPRVLQAHAGSVGAVLEGRLTEDIVARFDSTSTSSSLAAASPALHLALPLPAAKGAHLGLWKVLSEGETARTVLDTKDVGDALGSIFDAILAEGGRLEGGSGVLFAETASEDAVEGEEGEKEEEGEGTAASFFAKELLDADLHAARFLPRALAQPITTVELPPAGVKIFTLAKLFSLPSSSTDDAAGGGTLKIACLGLLAKHVGLAAVRRAEVAEGKKFEAEKELGAAADKKEGGKAAPTKPVLPALTESSVPTPSSLGSAVPSPALPTPPKEEQRLSPSASSTYSSSSSSARASSHRPIPQARLPFLLAYVFLPSAFTSSLPGSSSTSGTPRRPRFELRSLIADLFRRPLRTIFGEVGAVFSFGVATVLWALGRRTAVGSRNGVNGGEIAASPTETAAPVEEGTRKATPTIELGVDTLLPSSAAPLSPGLVSPPIPPSLNDQQTHLSLRFSHLSPRLGFYLPSSSSSSSLRFELDGEEVEECFVSRKKQIGGGEGGVLFEVDAEGAWRAQGGEEEVEGNVEGWRVTVAVV